MENDPKSVGEQEQVERLSAEAIAEVVRWCQMQGYALPRDVIVAQAQRIATLEAAMPLYDQWMAVGTYLASLHAERDQLREALKWYAAEAKAIADNMYAKPTRVDAMMASVTVLALDHGTRARAALAQKP